MSAISIIAIISILGSHLGVTATEDYTKHVNPFLGTEGPVPGSAYNSGNVFPGASLPFGAVKVGIDTTRWNTSFSANAGYTPDGNVTAITMLHESGTGGAPTYGLIPQMPLTTMENVNVLDNLTYMQPRTTSDIASVGYYKTELANGVTAEMSATHHAGIMRYSFPEHGDKYVLVDISHFIPSVGKKEQWYSNGIIEVSPDGSKYSGFGVWRQGWSSGGDFKVFFCATFSSSSTAQLFSGKYTDPYWPNTTGVEATFVNGNGESIVGGTEGYQYANRIGALFKFPDEMTVLESRVGVSWISVDKACQFHTTEMPNSTDFSSVVNSAISTWNEEVLSKISVSSTNETQLEMFYTALYHTHLLPSNRTGENPHWESTEPYYDDFYTLWDIFRCLTSLWTLIVPDRMEGIVRGLVDIWRFERFMPDGRSHNYNGRIQGGSNADNVLADYFVKTHPPANTTHSLNITSNVNWTEAYQAMLTNAELTPYNNFDFEDPTGSTKEGRGALPDWLEYGFVSTDFGRCISKTIEYSLNDFAVSQVAKGLGKDLETQKYLNRSANWQNIWSPTTTSLNFSGFLAPLNPNGTMQPYDPLSCGACEWSSITYEGVPWEYSWTVPFDMQTLISKMGGVEVVERRLDTMFVEGLAGSEVGGNGIGNMILNPGNEPSFQTPYLYNYLPKRQHKSVSQSRQVTNNFYSSTRSGLPGNDDAGALSSWLIWQMLGLYPVVTQPVYLLIAPWFEDVNITLPSMGEEEEKGRKLRIKAEGLGGNGGVRYVQSVKINGIGWDRSWVSHWDLVGGVDGGLIEFVMGEGVMEWDVGEVPPSPGHMDHGM